MVRRFLLSLVAFACASPLMATTIDFTRLDTTGWQNHSSYSGLTIEGATEENGRIQRGTADVGQWRHGGLGAKSADDSGNFDGTEQLDTQGANDALVFKFDRAVQLERITFAMTDYWDRFDLYMGEDLSFQRTYKVDDLRGYDWVSMILLQPGYIGTTFAIGASEYETCGYSLQFGYDCWRENSAFRITSITFSEVDTPLELDAVPVPPAFLLLLSAFLGLNLMKRRHCSQS